MNCINLKIKFNKKFECKRTKQEICLSTCKLCGYFERKPIKTSKCIAKDKKGLKGFKTRSKTVNKNDKKIYQQIAQEQSYCKLCGSTSNLHIHHIIYRSQLGKTEIGNLIRLCKTCHDKVHSNKKYWQPILLEQIKKD